MSLVLMKKNLLSLLGAKRGQAKNIQKGKFQKMPAFPLVYKVSKGQNVGFSRISGRKGDRSHKRKNLKSEKQV